MRCSSIGSSLISVLLCIALASAKLVVHDESFVPDHVLRVDSRNLSVACETRLSAVVNGSSPGPAIYIKPGVSSWIRVYNDMTEQNLTMHWHGIAQRMAPFSDGSVQASQWPIPPLHFFDYEVQPSVNDSGTYFYHSHVGLQAMTVFGPLIVEDCGDPPYDYDEERTLVWSDYFNKTDSVIEKGLVGVPFTWSGETNAVLLNGQGIGLGHTAEANACGACSLPVIDVAPGKTYRLRFIGATGLSLVTMGLEAHDNFTIVQVDGGGRVKPVSTKTMLIGSGQRYDVLFTTKSAEQLEADGRSTYFIQFETRDRPSVYVGYAVLRYSESAGIPAAPTTPVLRLANDTFNWLSYELQSLEPGSWPTLAEVTRRVIMDARQLLNPKTEQVVWQMNNLSWTEYSRQVPVLVDIYERGQAAVPNYTVAIQNQGWDPAVGSFAAKVGEVLEIVLENTGSLYNNGGGVDVHPFHAHGQHYFDMGSGNGSYDPIANELYIKKIKYDPPKRDTSMLYRYETKTTAGADAGWRAWRIRVEQPGVWMIHCHTLQHMVMGMQTVWVVGDAAQITDVPVEESSGYFQFGGSVYGNDTHDPSCVHYFGSEDSCQAWTTKGK